jgi:hypothetical protein
MSQDDLKKIIIAYCPSCGGDEIVVLQGQYMCTACKTKWSVEE